MSAAMERLSTSKRINSAADDVAGLSISTRLTTQIRHANQSIRNANDQISLLQTAEGGLEGITNALQRMRELRIQSLNGSSNASDKAFIEDEITNLKGDIDRILTTTEFNDIKILNGNAATAKWSASQGGEKPFIVAGSESSNIVSVFTSDENGGFKEQQLQGNEKSASVVIADMNSDGYLDIVTEENVFANDGNNVFTKVAYFPQPSILTTNVSVGDINSDNLPDIMIQQTGHVFQQFINKGSNVYQYYGDWGSNTLYSTYADLNADGNLDILAGTGGANVNYLYGDGNGIFTFDPRQGFGIQTIQRHINIKTGDVNSDGFTDVITLTANNFGLSVNLVFNLQNPDGTFGGAISVADAPFGMKLAVGDLNGDGKVDLVTTNTDSSFSIFLNQGDLTFAQTKIQLPQNRDNLAYASATGIAINDMTGDGSPDLLIGNGRTNAINIYKNAGDGSFTLLDTLTSDHGLDGVAVGGSFVYKDGSDNPVLKYLDNMKLASFNTANPSLDDIDSFLQAVNASRSEVGAYVSRLNNEVDNLSNQSLHAQESRSRILDADYSVSTTELAKQQIIQQAGIAMLAQANQQPQVVLQLLKSTSS